MAFGYFWFCGSASGKSSRTNFQRGGERFPLSSEERAGVRSSVQLIRAIRFAPFCFFRRPICFKLRAWRWR
jgi:hypothetical protein